MSLFDGFFSLQSPANKSKEGEWKNKEGIQEPVPELKLEMDDQELLSLAKQWETKWIQYSKQWEDKYKKNERYWKGLHYSDQELKNNPVFDNVIFQAVETMLPMATNRNPEPMVMADDTPEGRNLAKSARSMLVFQADRLRLKKRLRKTLRYWFIYLVGAMKMGWSLKENDISSPVLHPTKLILDSDSTIDDDMEYTGEYIGEFMEETASVLIKRFPSHTAEITKEAQGKLGSKIKYTEWWTDDYVFWKMKEVVLGKAVNPHWVEDKMTTQVDEMGNQTEVMIKGRNHFTSKKKPYIFFSLFNLGKHPHDDTSLIGQVISQQDVINKRNRQIDVNVEGMNGGWGFSEEKSGLNKEQCAQAVEAVRKGGAIVVPSGAVGDAITRLVGSGLPSDVFNNLKDTRNEIQNIFGISGSNPSGIRADRTVQGKQLIKAQDESRIGTLAEELEQFADQVFNWWVQLFYVYYDEEHSAAILGEEKAQEFVTLKNDQLIAYKRRLSVTIKEGSMLPKDEVSQANQAMQLAGTQLIDPITLFDKLNYSNPREMAKRLWIWQNSPQTLFQGDPQMESINQQASASQDEQDLKDAAVMDQEHQNKLEEIATDHMLKGKPSNIDVPKVKPEVKK